MRLDHRASPQEAADREVKRDALATTLRNATPAQVDRWVDSNIQSIADLRRVLKIILKILIALYKR